MHFMIYIFASYKAEQLKSQPIEIELSMDFLDSKSLQAFNILKKVVGYYQGKVRIDYRVACMIRIATLNISKVTNSICKFDNVDEPFKVPLS